MLVVSVKRVGQIGGPKRTARWFLWIGGPKRTARWVPQSIERQRQAGWVKGLPGNIGNDRQEGLGELAVLKGLPGGFRSPCARPFQEMQLDWGTLGNGFSGQNSNGAKDSTLNFIVQFSLEL